MTSKRRLATIGLLGGLALALALTACSDGDGPGSGPGVVAGTTWVVPTDLPTIASAADTAEQGDVIEVLPGTYAEHGIVLDIGVALRGSTGKADDVVIDGGGLGRVLTVRLDEETVPRADRDTLTRISDLVITGGAGDSRGGGGLLLERPAVLENVRFTENTAVGSGGGARCDDVSVRFLDCGFTGNTAGRSANIFGGGGLMVFGGEELTCEIVRCSFAGNSSEGGGGGAMVAVSPARVAHCTFVGNAVTESGSIGGGFACTGFGTVRARVDTCAFTLNTNVSDGGGVGAYGGVDVTGCNFADNVAVQGGGLFMPHAVRTSSFIGNEAIQYGGGVFMGPGEITDCAFSENSAVEGAGLFGNGAATVLRTEFSGHTAGSATVYWVGESALTMSHCGVRNNGIRGVQAIHLADLALDNCVIENNAGSGLALISGSRAELADCTIAGNTAGSGSALYLEMTVADRRTAATLTSCSLTGNTTTAPGGTIDLYGEADVTATYCVITGNSAPTWPVALVTPQATATFTCCGVAPADVGGGGTVTIDDSDCVTTAIR